MKKRLVYWFIDGVRINRAEATGIFIVKYADGRMKNNQKIMEKKILEEKMMNQEILMMKC